MLRDLNVYDIKTLCFLADYSTEINQDGIKIYSILSDVPDTVYTNVPREIVIDFGTYIIDKDIEILGIDASISNIADGYYWNTIRLFWLDHYPNDFIKENWYSRPGASVVWKNPDQGTSYERTAGITGGMIYLHKYRSIVRLFIQRECLLAWGSQDAFISKFSEVRLVYKKKH